MKLHLTLLTLVATCSMVGLYATEPATALRTLQREADPRSGLYIKADAGHTVGTHIKSMLYDVGLGYRWNDSWKTDVTFTARPSGKYRVEHGPVHSPEAPYNNHSLMLNMTYTAGFDIGAKPYIGIGVGGFHNMGKNIEYTEDTTYFISHMDKSGFTGSINLGLEYAINEFWSIDLGYKAIGLGYIKTERYSTDGYSKTHDLEVSHEVMLGLVFNL